jgi:hypothetical protein
MRLAVILVALICFYTSCIKLKEEKLKYVINATYDTSINTWSMNRNTITVNVEKTDGDDEPVTLTMENLPWGMEATIEKATGVPPFSTTIKFRSDTAENTISLWKEYTVTIKGATEKKIYRSCEAKFNYLPADAAAPFAFHMFRIGEFCSPSGDNTKYINLFSYTPDAITLDGFYYEGMYSWDVPATLNAKTKTITIGPYTEGYYTFTGSGTFYSIGDTGVGCTIGYTRSRIGLSNTCTATMVRTD